MSDTTDGKDRDDAQHENDTRLLAVCRDCDYVEATTVDERPIGDPEDDPAFRHYDETGHNTGSFEPGSELLNDQFEIVFNDGDRGDLRDDLWDLCTDDEYVPEEVEA